jgi:hypothetical protein
LLGVCVLEVVVMCMCIRCSGPVYVY